MSTPHEQGRVIRILFVGLKYDYGDPARGWSYEHVNFFGTLEKMPNVAATSFPVDELMRTNGRPEMNRQLLETVSSLQPDICFFFLFTDEIAKETIETISRNGRTKTVNWFADDHWRFKEFSRHWAPLFHWVVTTDREAVAKYERAGCRNVMLLQWGYNHFLYQPVAGPADLDVSFVGQVHSNRKTIVRSLERRGIKVDCWGKGWPNGRLNEREMIRLYSRSRINLNFTESSYGFRLKPMLKLLLARRADDTIRLRTPRETLDHLSTLLHPRRAQIKGRNFEIPGSGGFLLTQLADGIEEYFIPGKEVATFSTADELHDRIRYYLSHDEERDSIRNAGYQRASSDHTYQHRFETMMTTMLPA
jgi:spore maturation protein CgeB